MSDTFCYTKPVGHNIRKEKTMTTIYISYSAGNLFEQDADRDPVALNGRLMRYMESALAAEFPGAKIAIDPTWDCGAIESIYELTEDGVDYNEVNPADGNARVQAVCERVWSNGEFWC